MNNEDGSYNMDLLLSITKLSFYLNPFPRVELFDLQVIKKEDCVFHSTMGKRELISTPNKRR